MGQLMEAVFKQLGILLTCTMIGLILGVVCAFLLARSAAGDAPGAGIGMLWLIWFGGFVGCVIGAVLVLYRWLAGKLNAPTKK